MVKERLTGIDYCIVVGKPSLNLEHMSLKYHNVEHSNKEYTY